MTTTTSAVESVRVVRHGAALEVGFSGGATRIVRRIDLAPILGEVRPAEEPPRFAGAAVHGHGVRIMYEDGSIEDMRDEELRDPAERALHERRADLVIEGAGCLLTASGHDQADPLGIIPHGAIVCGGGRVLWVGPDQDLGRSGHDLDAAQRVHAGGRLVTPGLVDCHAHPLFGGNRAQEFSRRAEGRSYLEIAAAGGGIKATMEPTRALGFDEHVRLCRARMARALAAGTTTCEAKSGYDLTAEGELRLLEIAWAVDALQPVDLVPTLLGAHVLPPEYAHDRMGFVRLVTESMIPEVVRRGLSRTADVYCDEGAFTLDETRLILGAARRAGMHVRAHAGQFADLGAAELVAELGGLSADHLEVISDAGIAAMAAHHVVAVMLPGACVQLRMTPPPVARLRKAGVKLALASDLNPGTSLCETLPVQMWLATTHYGMTVSEAWLGVTAVAAQALDRRDVGVLGPGSLADIVIWDAEAPAEIPYHYGVDLVHRVIKSGRTVVSRAPG